MNTNDNKQITTEKFLFLLKQHIDFLESQMAERCGMKLYKSADGFTQEEIYEYAGANDCVATLTLNQESAKLSFIVFSFDTPCLHETSIFTSCNIIWISLR